MSPAISGTAPTIGVNGTTPSSTKEPPTTRPRIERSVPVGVAFASTCLLCVDWRDDGRLPALRSIRRRWLGLRRFRLKPPDGSPVPFLLGVPIFAGPPLPLPYPARGRARLIAGLERGLPIWCSF